MILKSDGSLPDPSGTTAHAEQSGRPCPFRLFVGLGNPGSRYTGTRHNLGFALLEHWAERHALHWSEEPHWQAKVARLGGLWLMKPQTYMNLSGDAVQPFANFYKIAPGQILVLCDDLALPPGRLRLRAFGSDGGQKGLASILQRLGTQRVPRLRIGIGQPPAWQDAAHYVLQSPAPSELSLIARALEEAVEILEWLMAGRFQEAQQRANSFRPAPASPG